MNKEVLKMMENLDNMIIGLYEDITDLSNYMENKQELLINRVVDMEEKVYEMRFKR